MSKMACVLQSDRTRPLQYGFNCKSSGLYPGGTRSIRDRGLDVFFWVENLHPLYSFGSKDLSYFFLGLKVFLELELISIEVFMFFIFFG